VDPESGSVFIADYGDNLIRMIDPNGTMWSVAGTRVSARTGDGSNASSASLLGPRGMAFDAYGNLVVAEVGSSSIRMIAYGTNPECPSGYYCACGLKPVPCSSPDTVCVSGSTAPLNATPGFVSVRTPSPIASSGGVYADLVSASSAKIILVR
jgi:hypothetical protein